ncbi:hypothetical protein F5Y03DRAFT_366773 [Xylaria venustula]|nr:hypothetical protein F5Y03DRAFT_366773 [Xylaria venustula]
MNYIPFPRPLFLLNMLLFDSGETQPPRHRVRRLLYCKYKIGKNKKKTKMGIHSSGQPEIAASPIDIHIGLQI